MMLALRWQSKSNVVAVEVCLWGNWPEFQLSCFEERQLEPMAFNLPFQPGEVLRERAGTNCAHSFRFLRDEQNMVADSRFDGSLIQQ